uniref:Zinc finger, matrin-type 2 n=1 Tax=Sinocyclocheilus anshuiensis TaxID=1608454 RepID=A0A671MTK5_9TELE
MASGSGSKNDFRRKWDKDEYEQLAQKRLTEERERKKMPVPPVKRELLRHRDYKVDLESKLGKTIVITKTTPQAEMGGYYCNVCDCVVKDSINFLDYINGKKRKYCIFLLCQKSLGFKKRFEVNKKKLEEKQKEYGFEERMKELREEEKAKAYRKEKQKEKKRKAEEDLNFEDDDEMAAVMGFSGFGSCRKGH